MKPFRGQTTAHEQASCDVSQLTSPADPVGRHDVWLWTERNAVSLDFGRAKHSRFALNATLYHENGYLPSLMYLEWSLTVQFAHDGAEKRIPAAKLRVDAGSDTNASGAWIPRGLPSDRPHESRI